MAEGAGGGLRIGIQLHSSHTSLTTVFLMWSLNSMQLVESTRTNDDARGKQVHH